MTEPGTVVIVGAGPGVGAATARRFGREGYRIGMIARTEARLETMVDELNAAGIVAAGVAADARNADDLRSALDALRAELGHVRVISYSPLPAAETIKPVTEMSVENVEASLRLGVLGSVAVVGWALPEMRRSRDSSVLFTTGSAVIRPNPARATIGIVNAAQATYYRMLNQALAAEGVHAQHFIVVGPIGQAGHDPDAIADALWAGHTERSESQTIIESAK